MHRIVPELIVENYAAGRRRGYFPAAALFIDISGFSTITDVLMRHGQAGAEELTRLMRSVFDPLIGGALQYGGEVVGLAGDAITAVFDASEDMDLAVRRGLAAAWDIQQQLKAIGSLSTDYGEFRISAKIGLAAGEAHWGILESRDGGKATYYVRGSAIDDSAAAERQALAGEILLSAAAHDALSGSAQTEARGRFQLVKQLNGPSVERCPVGMRPFSTEVARIFAPEALLTQAVRGEFRQAVNLFVRIPDLPDEGLQEFIAAVFDLQDQYGGLISHIDFGDKGCNLLMMWGAPVTYENDIGRALNFILELQTKVDFPVTAGVTFHLALAGYIGSEQFEDYTCYGWGVNLAARFMMSAQDGAIWLDERIVQRTHRAFSVEYLGEQNFKGFAQKQKVYILKGRKAETDSFYDGRLEGRDAELRVLAQAIEPLRRNEPAGVIVVAGEAGIGKSRLVHEFKGSSLFSGWQVLWAVCQSDQVLRQSFNPLRYWLLRYFGVLAAPDEATRLQALHARFDELRAATGDEALADDLERARSFLAALVDLHWADSPYERMDAQGRYDNTVLALMTLLKAESCRQPVILLIEDAHFLDEDSQAFLLRLKRSLTSERSYPIAMLITSRPEGSGVAGNEGFADTRLDIAGLSSEAITALSDDILGRPAAPDLVRFITLRAEGNPFFAEQMLRYLQDEAVLELSEAGRWVIRGGWQSSALPADISTMLVARLDQLARQVKDVIQTASVLGREFEVQVLRRMLSDDPTLDVRVSEAERASIWSPLNELRYLFRHALLRDAAYSMQLQAHRRELHALAVQALESLYASELASHYPELAFHSEQAALKDKARFYLRRAADAARDAYQNAEALDAYGRALQLVRPEELRERFNLIVERVMLLRRMGKWDVEALELNRLETLAQEIGDPATKARVQMLRAEHMLNSGDFRQTIAYAEQALDLSRTVMDAETTLGATMLMPGALLRLGRFEEAMQQARDGLRLAAHLARRPEQGLALNWMGLVALEQGEPARARNSFEQALTIARGCSDRLLEAKALNNLGKTAGEMERDYDAARAYYEQTYAIDHERGDRAAEGISLANLGFAAGAQGDYASAREYQDRALAVAREIGDPYLEAYTLINLSAVTGTLGDAAAALRFARDAETLALRIGDRSALAWALLYKGHGHSLFREFDSAQEAFRACVDIRQELQQAGLATEAMAGLIHAALELGDADDALRWTEAVLVHLAGGGTLDGTEEPLRVYLACYRVLEARGDARAKSVLKDAHTMLEAQLARFADEQARRAYVERVPWRLAVQQAWEKGATA